MLLMNGAIATQFQRTGILASCTINLGCPIPSDINTTIYRILEEAMINIQSKGSTKDDKGATFSYSR